MTADSGPKDDVHEAQRKLAADVHDHLAEGRPGLARQAALNAIDDVHPEQLPLRFSMLVLRPNSRQVLALKQAMLERGRSPRLTLHMEADVDWFDVRWGGERLGRLSTKDSELLATYGASLSVFEVRLLQLKIDDEARLVESFSIELVRPETRHCSNCGELHATDHMNCPKCRAQRKRKGVEEDTLEQPPIALQRVLDALSQQRQRKRS